MKGISNETTVAPRFYAIFPWSQFYFIYFNKIQYNCWMGHYMLISLSKWLIMFSWISDFTPFFSGPSKSVKSGFHCSYIGKKFHNVINVEDFFHFVKSKLGLSASPADPPRPWRWPSDRPSFPFQRGLRAF